MSNISSVVAQVFVDDLDAAIPLYQQLAQTTGSSPAIPTGAVFEYIETGDQRP